MVETNILSFTKITSLALADSVNPCALAVLTMILVAILMANPKNKHKVLMGGLSFTAAVYIGYMFYGLVLVQLFTTFTNVLRSQTQTLNIALGTIAMILGALNIKDYFSYRPGGIGTEMPFMMRPTVKRLTAKATSPSGAFIIGILVTVFLLPCTIGPYIVATGLIHELGFIKVFPWLLYYNLIFVLPMIFVTGIVYFGLAKVEDVSGWKERNIRRLHLIAGTLLFLVGFGMVLGWF
jgi:cytochrome c biogenesis protein CcdA